MNAETDVLIDASQVKLETIKPIRTFTRLVDEENFIKVHVALTARGDLFNKSANTILNSIVDDNKLMFEKGLEYNKIFINDLAKRLKETVNYEHISKQQYDKFRKYLMGIEGNFEGGMEFEGFESNIKLSEIRKEVNSNNK